MAATGVSLMAWVFWLAWVGQPASAAVDGPAASTEGARACDAAVAFAGARGSSSLVITRGAEILAEARWDRPGSRVELDADGWPVEDVASLQKSITAVLVAIAVERRLLRLEDPVARWLGPGWSRASVEAEAAITVRHLLAMTSGLRDDLTRETTAGTAWRYNTPAYARLLSVLAVVAKEELPELSRHWLTGPLGMTRSRWERRSGPASLVNPWGFLTTAHDLVRFGRMVLAGGRPVIADQALIDAMLRPSQALNPDYGLLWWLNSAKVPGRAGLRIPSAPRDLLAAEGARDCRLYLVPASGLIVVRLGEPAGRGFAEELWSLLGPAAAGR